MKMNYKLFGNSGLRVSELCLGTMTFGEEWGWGANQNECEKIFELYNEAGGNFIDTANFYTGGTSEEMVGQFIAGKRERFVVASKYTLSMDASNPNASGNHRKNMMASVEASLKRMQTDYMDILWLHAWDFASPMEEVLRGLNDLVSQGKIHYFGISDAPAWVVSRANTLSELRGWNSFLGLQVEYSLIRRTIERDLLPMAKFYDMAVTTWGPLSGGILTGKYNKESIGDVRYKEGPWADAYRTPANLDTAQAVVELAQEIDRSPAQVALRWVYQQQQRANIIPILGARKVTQLQDNLSVLDFELGQEHMDRLNAITKIELGFPHDFLNTVPGVIFGDEHERIKNHRDYRAL